MLSRHLTELEQSLRDERSRSLLSDEDLSDVSSRISSLIQNIQLSLKSEVDKLAQTRQSIEQSQSTGSFSPYMTPHFAKPSIMNSEYSTTSSHFMDSITTTSTVTLPETYTMSHIYEWLDEWEMGKEATQDSVERLTDLLQSLQVERKKRLGNIDLDEDLEYNNVFTDNDTISTSSETSSDTELEEEYDFGILPPTKQLPKTPEDETSSHEPRILASPSLNKIFASINEIMSGLLSAISRVVRLCKNLFIGEWEVPTKMIIKTDPLCLDLFEEEEDCDEYRHYFDFGYPRLFDSSQKPLPQGLLCLL